MPGLSFHALLMSEGEAELGVMTAYPAACPAPGYGSGLLELARVRREALRALRRPSSSLVMSRSAVRVRSSALSTDAALVKQ